MLHVLGELDRCTDFGMFYDDRKQLLYSLIKPRLDTPSMTPLYSFIVETGKLTVGCHLRYRFCVAGQHPFPKLIDPRL
jgi:hypothetical protein